MVIPEGGVGRRHRHYKKVRIEFAIKIGNKTKTVLMITYFIDCAGNWEQDLNELRPVQQWFNAGYA